MTNSNTLRINLRFLNWVMGALVALGCWSVLAGDILSDNEEDLQIVLTRESIRIGATVLCSVAALETNLASQPRTTHVNVEVAPDVSTGIFARVMEILRTLGFEQVSNKGAGDPGWTLYPFPPDTEFPGCSQHLPEEAEEQKSLRMTANKSLR
jgi:hypothetical protein